MVAVVLYNPETPGLENKEEVHKIREEFITILR